MRVRQAPPSRTCKTTQVAGQHREHRDALSRAVCLNPGRVDGFGQSHRGTTRRHGVKGPAGRQCSLRHVPESPGTPDKRELLMLPGPNCLSRPDHIRSSPPKGNRSFGLHAVVQSELHERIYLSAMGTLVGGCHHGQAWCRNPALCTYPSCYLSFTECRLAVCRNVCRCQTNLHWEDATLRQRPACVRAHDHHVQGLKQ